MDRSKLLMKAFVQAILWKSLITFFKRSWPTCKDDVHKATCVDLVELCHTQKQGNATTALKEC